MSCRCRVGCRALCEQTINIPVIIIGVGCCAVLGSNGQGQEVLVWVCRNGTFQLSSLRESDSAASARMGARKNCNYGW